MPQTNHETISSSQIYQAYRLLFGRSYPSGMQVQQLKPDSIKRAYRRRALETHPDRFVGADVNVNKLQQQFVQVTEAYRILQQAMEKGVTRISRQPSASPARAASSTGSGARRAHKNKARPKERTRQYYAGPMPSRPLRLGEFLYYAGHISWQDLVASLVWQRQQRMRFGEIAQSWGLLNEAALARIFKAQQGGELFGECALRLGELSAFQQMAVLGKQRMQRPLLGGYFIREGLLSEEDLSLAQREADLHNAKFSMAQAA